MRRSFSLVLFFFIFIFLGWLVEHLEHGCLDGLLFDVEAVLEPDEVVKFGFEFVPLLAPFEKPINILVVRILGESQLSAVLHELEELVRLVFAKVLKSHLLLLFLNIIVLLIFGSSWKSLPWKTTSQEV